MLSLENFQPKKQLPIVIFLYVPLILAVVFVMLFFPQNAKKILPDSNNLAKSQKIQTKAYAYEKMSYAEVEQNLLAVLQEKNPKFALEDLKIAMNENAAIANRCHGLVHTIGRAAYEKYKIFDQALVFEDNTCGSGYIHGVIEARLAKATDVFSELQSLCKDNSGTCYHGVGHGLMLYTSNNVPASLAYCDTIKHDQGRLFCSEGVFMENFNTDTALHPSDFLKPNDPFFPCGEQNAVYKGTCYFYAPDYYLNLHPKEFSSALKWCESAEEGFQLICLNGLGSRMMKRNITQPKEVEKVCNQVDPTRRTYCIDGMASYYLVHHYSLEKGKEMCGTLETANREACNHAVNIRSGLFPQ